MIRVVTLRGITLKGKNRVREHGKLWRVMKDGKQILGEIETDWLLLESFSTPADLRWVKKIGDKDFFIESERQMTDLQILNTLSLDVSEKKR